MENLFAAQFNANAVQADDARSTNFVNSFNGVEFSNFHLFSLHSPLVDFASSLEFESTQLMQFLICASEVKWQSIAKQSAAEKKSEIISNFNTFMSMCCCFISECIQLSEAFMFMFAVEHFPFVAVAFSTLR